MAEEYLIDFCQKILVCSLTAVLLSHLYFVSDTVFHINIRLNINHINHSSKMDIFVLYANKICKYDQITKCLSLKFSVLLSCFYFFQKVVKM